MQQMMGGMGGQQGFARPFVNPTSTGQVSGGGLVDLIMQRIIDAGLLMI